MKAIEESKIRQQKEVNKKERENTNTNEDNVTSPTTLLNLTNKTKQK